MDSSPNDVSLNLNTIDNYKLSDEGISDFQLLEQQINASSGSTLNLERDYIGDGSETVHIYDDVTIDGKGHTITQSDKKGLSAFEIVSGKVTLKNLKICDTHKKGNGGAIYVNNGGRLSLENCTFKNNKANDHGGAIYTENNASLIVKDCIFESNSADDYGGAIYAQSVLKLIDSTFKYNKAESCGGAIHYSNEDQLEIKKCTFESNEVKGAILDVCHGGAIYTDFGGSLRIEKCIFTNNKAYDYGGAIYAQSALRLIDSTFKNNKAEENGGAIYYYSNKELEIERCTFESNEANGAILAGMNGGAICSPINTKIVVWYSIFKSNSAHDSGGAIYSMGELKLYDTLFESNIAKRRIRPEAEDDGGAVYCTKSVTADRCTFKSNEAIHYGGAIYSESGPVKLIKSLFQSNTAKGGVIASSSGGAVYSKGQVFVDSCTFENNLAGSYGGAIYAKDVDIDNNKNGLSNYASSFINNYADTYGGAIFSKKNTTVSYALFSGNTAKSDGGAICTNNLSARACLFESNEAKGAIIYSCHGGAVYADETATVDKCTFNNNFAENYGGAIYAENGLKLVGKESFFTNNTANEHGGAIYTSTFIENPVSATFISNYAKKNGGAIYINNKNEVALTKMAFIKNHCDGEGGAIYVDSSKSKLALEKNIFLSNSAKEGQSVYNCGKYTSIKNNWWGYTNPSSGNDQLIEWKAWPKSNIHHSDSSPLKLTLKLISDATKDEHAVENETVCALLSFKTSDEDTVNMNPIFNSNLVKFTSDKNIQFQDKGNNNDGVYSIFISKSEGEHEISADFYGYSVSTTAITDEDSPGNDEGMYDDEYGTIPNYSPSFTQTLIKTPDNISNSTANATKNMTKGSAVKSIVNPQSENGSFNYYLLALLALIVIAAIGIYKYRN